MEIVLFLPYLYGVKNTCRGREVRTSCEEAPGCLSLETAVWASEETAVAEEKVKKDGA